MVCVVFIRSWWRKRMVRDCLVCYSFVVAEESEWYVIVCVCVLFIRTWGRERMVRDCLYMAFIRSWERK